MSLRRRRRGMTLVEIMVVIAILVMLSSAVAIWALSQAEQARIQRARLDMKSIVQALDLYKAQHGRYPDAQPLSSLQRQLALTEVHDPWRREYLYSVEGGTAVVRTLGADGAPGGEGEDADLSSADPEH